MAEDTRRVENAGRWRNGRSVGALLEEVQRDVKTFLHVQNDYASQMEALIAAVQALHPPGFEMQLPRDHGLRHTAYDEGEHPHYSNSPVSGRPHQYSNGNGHYPSPLPSPHHSSPFGAAPPLPADLPDLPESKGVHGHNGHTQQPRHRMQEMMPGAIEDSTDDEHARDQARPHQKRGKKLPASPNNQYPPPPDAAPRALYNDQALDVAPGNRKNKKGMEEDDEREDSKETRQLKLAMENKVKINNISVKEKIKSQLMMPQYNVTIYYRTTGIFQYVARMALFENVTLSVIAGNALWLWIDTDYNDQSALLLAHPVFQFAENGFCLYFSLELFIRFMAFQNKCNCGRDPWFVFDSFLVITMVLETWVMTSIIIISGADSLISGGNSGILRLARLLRLSRMARMARLIRAIPELAILIKGMIASMRSVVTTLFLLVIVMYIFAIAFKQLTEGNPVGEETFGYVIFDSVPRSMYTLWLYGVLCLDFAEGICDELGPAAALLYYFFILLAPYTIMNMLIGVLCEVVSAVASTENEANLIGYAREQLQAIMCALDENHSGSISQKEFHQLLEKKEACFILQDLGVDVVGLIDFADVIFEPQAGSTNPDDGPVELIFEQFVDAVLQLRGSSHATVKDIVQLRKMIQKELKAASKERLHHGATKRD